jgi:hypothetical protein
VKALVDVHHADLLEAMHCLLEDRLGLEVFVPFGMEWYLEGYAPYGSEDVARQFLVSIGEHTDFHPRRLRLLTLPEFKAMDGWAVMVATMAEQQWGFKRLADEKGARFAIQVGNVRQFIDYRLDPIVLGPGGIPMHQEFDKDGAFRFSPYAGDRRTVGSFVNIFPLLPDYRHLEEARQRLPDWKFNVHGHHGPDGFIKPTSAIAELMKGYAFGWHDKETGDGFGHVIHQWAAIGRPLIGHASYYRGQLAEDLWEDGVTCIDLDKHSVKEATEMMFWLFSDRHLYDNASHAIRARLDARIDYAAEARVIGEALGLLVPA